jgi:hypothetical protein
MVGIEKKWYKSKTIQGGLGMVVMGAGTMAGELFKQPEIVPIAQQVVTTGIPLLGLDIGSTDFLKSVAEMFFGLLVIVGRIKAASSIVK